MFAAPSAPMINKTPPAAHPAPAHGRKYPHDDLIGAGTCGAATLHFRRDETVEAQGDIPRYCYQITSGCIRTVKLLDDGRRHVGEFLFAGDLFGWEGGGHRETAFEAVTPTTLHRVRLDLMENRVATDAGFARRLHDYIISQVRLGRERLVAVGRKTATERVCAFLIDMQKLLAEPGQAAFTLPMSRADIGDYLGLTLETVSRTLTDLRRRGIVTVLNTNIVIRDPRALRSTGSLLVH